MQAVISLVAHAQRTGFSIHAHSYYLVPQTAVQVHVKYNIFERFMYICNSVTDLLVLTLILLLWLYFSCCVVL